MAIHGLLLIGMALQVVAAMVWLWGWKNPRELKQSRRGGGKAGTLQKVGRENDD